MVETRERKIKAFLIDVDGVLTDGGIYIGENVEIFKKFNVKDGYAIKTLLKKKIKVAIITGRESKIVSNRAKEMGIKQIFQNVDDKLAVYGQFKKINSLTDEQIVYVGDDFPDMEIIRKSISFCPADSVNQIKYESKHVLIRKGGEGCIMEIVDFLTEKDLL